MKRISKLIFIFLTFFINEIEAQEKQVWHLDYRADIFSRHLWRGEKLGDSPAIEPEITLLKGNFGFSIWGATTFNNSYNEIDLILNYQVLPWMNIVFYDYYNPVPDENNEYWQYKGDKMCHTLELTSNLATDNYPLSLLAGVFFYGDKDSISGKEHFSTYIEPAFNFTLAGEDLCIFVGFTPFKGYYANGFSFVNLGVSMSHAFQVASQCELPVEFTFCSNPYTKQTYFTFGIGIKTKE